MSAKCNRMIDRIFKKGDRIKLSEYGLDHFKFDRRYGEHTRGTVMTNPNNQTYIQVRRDGIRSTYGYAAHLWVHDD